MVGGGVNILLILKKPLESGFLLRAALENDQHAVQREIGVRFALIERALGQGMNIAGKCRSDTVIDGCDHQARGRWRRIALLGWQIKNCECRDQKDAKKTMWKAHLDLSADLRFKEKPDTIAARVFSE